MSVLNKPRMVNLIRQNHWIVSICFTRTPPTHFIKIKWAKDLSFCHTKRRKKRDDFLLPKSSLFFLKPWMNEQKISRILFVHPLKYANSMVSFNPVLTSQKHRIVLGRFNKKSSRFWMTTKF